MAKRHTVVLIFQTQIYFRKLHFEKWLPKIIFSPKYLSVPMTRIILYPHKKISGRLGCLGFWWNTGFSKFWLNILGAQHVLLHPNESGAEQHVQTSNVSQIPSINTTFQFEQPVRILPVSITFSIGSDRTYFCYWLFAFALIPRTKKSSLNPFSFRQLNYMVQNSDTLIYRQYRVVHQRIWMKRIGNRLVIHHQEIRANLVPGEMELTHKEVEHQPIWR